MSDRQSKFPPFILGSASPRRRDLLKELGIRFEIHTVDVNEDQITDPDPAKNVLERAKLKAKALLPQFGKQALILTADTSISFQGQLLNKPSDDDEARAMLRALRSTPHQVYTGMVLVDLQQQIHSKVNVTDITMRPYSDAEIESYIASGDPKDKAGAYAIQHPEFRPVSQLSGCYSGVMGLSLCDLLSQFEQLEGEACLNKSKRFEKRSKIGLCDYCQFKFNRLKIAQGEKVDIKPN